MSRRVLSVAALVALLTTEVSPVIAHEITKDEKEAIVRISMFDEQNLNWAKLPGDWIPSFLAAYNDFEKDGNRLECFNALTRGGGTEEVDGEAIEVITVNFTNKSDYVVRKGEAAPRKSFSGCGKNMHYTVSKDGKFLKKYKQK